MIFFVPLCYINSIIMKKLRATLLAAAVILSLMAAVPDAAAQNPICPEGTFFSDPQARVWSDGRAAGQYRCVPF